MLLYGGCELHLRRKMAPTVLLALLVSVICTCHAYQSGVYDIICASEGCFTDCGSKAFCSHPALTLVHNNAFTSFLRAYHDERREFTRSRSAIKLRVYEQFHISSFKVNFSNLNIYSAPEHSVLTDEERSQFADPSNPDAPYCIMELNNNVTGVCRVEPGRSAHIISFPWRTACHGANGNIFVRI